jgi:membrane-associated phospholipid phosphatase
MHTSKFTRFTISASKVLSALFSPLLIPTYCMTTAMWITPLVNVAERVRFISTVVVLGLTALVPLVALLTMIRSGVVSDLDVSQRKQRFRPMLAILSCYILTVAYICWVNAPWWLIMYFVSGCITTIVVGLITLKWKVSGHAAGLGNMIGMLSALCVQGLTNVQIVPWIMVAIIIAGLVGSARVILHKHTPLQVFVGVVLSAVITILIMGIHVPYIQV